MKFFAFSKDVYRGEKSKLYCSCINKYDFDRKQLTNEIYFPQTYIPAENLIFVKDDFSCEISYDELPQ